MIRETVRVRRLGVTVLGVTMLVVVVYVAVISHEGGV